MPHASADSVATRGIARRKALDAVFAVVGAGLVVLALTVLALLLWRLMQDGHVRLTPAFFTSFPTPDPETAGIKAAFVGTCLVMLVTAMTALPLGVAAGIYLEEYGRKNWVTTIIEINIANLAGVPSIIWGLMALGLFINFFGLGKDVFTGGLTLGLLVLPIVIVATRESVRAIPQAIREASYACGATRLQTVGFHVLPYSLGGILTGSIIALSRAIGETAPLITIGAATYIGFLPSAPFSAKDWRSDTISAVEIAPADITRPFGSPDNASFRAFSAAPPNGDFTIRIREIGKPERPPVSIAIRPDHETPAGQANELAASSIQGLSDAIGQVPGLMSYTTSDGRIAISADSDLEFVLSDTSGLVAALKLPRGGGVNGPFEWLTSSFSALPIQIYNWISRPDAGFHINAAAASLVLLVITLAMNAVAIILRYRLRKRIQW